MVLIGSQALCCPRNNWFCDARPCIDGAGGAGGAGGASVYGGVGGAGGSSCAHFLCNPYSKLMRISLLAPWVLLYSFLT